MEQREESKYSQETWLGGTDQVIEYHFDNKEVEERNEEEENRTTKASKLMSWLRKMWTAPTGTQSRVQNEEEENPRTRPNMNPGDAEVVDTETSSELEEGGAKHKAPDEKRRPLKTINDMESVAKDKEGELFGWP